jgi:hypothetical protein
MPGLPPIEFIFQNSEFRERLPPFTAAFADLLRKGWSDRHPIELICEKFGTRPCPAQAALTLPDTVGQRRNDDLGFGADQLR